MTPTSSNSSAAHLPARSQNSSTRAPSGGASLLQERLRERKVESARQSRRRSIDMDAERGVQSSPVRGPREERRPSSSGIVAAKGMGVKQIEEQVSTLHKQNFDLKLELYHRRQRQEALEARLESLEKQVEEQAELQEVNEQLLAELEKRDQAVEEAVGIIVGLEDKVDKLMQERGHVKDFDRQYGSGYFQSNHDDDGPPSSPPEFKDNQLVVSKGSLPRMPSFLSETTEGTEALRSLYLPHSQYSDANLPKLQEEGTASGMDSPRLSVLSKSSFLSVYGDKQLSLDASESPEDTPRRHRASSSIDKWVADGPAQANTTPVRPSPPLRKSQFLSINDVLESPLQRLEKLKHTLEKHNTSLAPVRTQPERTVSVQDKRKSRDALRRVFTDQASFEHQQTLPPTPDTISTSTLRHYQYSNDTLAGDHKRQGTFLNSTSTFPVPRTTQNAHQSTVSVRPRSAGETVTSRREGHGWDTETQDDITDTCSQSSNASASGYYRSKNSMSPSFFNFSTENSWGRDLMFNNEPSLPSHPASRYEELRRSSMVDPLRSDGTVVPSRDKVQTRYVDTPQYGTIPIDTSPKPQPPDRRSSLSASTKLRIAAGPTSTQAPESSPSPSKDSKKSRLPSLRIFGRSETSPTKTGFQQSAQHTMRPKNTAQRGQTYTGGGNSYEDEELARATPPPIRRSRGQQPSGYRPVSAGSGAIRRDSTFDAAAPTQGPRQAHARRGSVNESAEAEENKAGRKWFSIGRSNSLRRA
ncbi:hypothetical protein N431DRAFT_352554 [Stipitochalara longipes BDJ]|nr:hypothetical protein N431DRAFT_352554 [Stipitochalara longipes BDJ]